MTKPKEPGDYAPGNMDGNGNYLVGKGRPPENGKFRAGDNRKRGRRAKGTRNLASDLREELETVMTVMVGGKPRRVTRQRAVVMRLADNAGKGRDRSIEHLFKLQQALVEPLLGQGSGVEFRDLSHLSDEELDLLQLAAVKFAGADIPADLLESIRSFLLTVDPAPVSPIELGD